MNSPELAGVPAELRFQMSITRAATGLTEEFEMVGHIVPEEEVPSETPQ